VRIALHGEGGAPIPSGSLAKGSGSQGIVVTMTGVEAITFGLAAALAAGTVAFRASVPRVAGVALLSAAAVGFFLALLHWGRWLPW
jgi:hypothetical protein